MAKGNKVECPTKKSEYDIWFATTGATRGWNDLKATIRNSLVDTRDFQMHAPMVGTPTNQPLKGKLGLVTRDGSTHERWQHKPTAKGDAHIWFYVVGQNVHVEQVHTNHPNETK